jgi:hypothetical protein
MVTTRIRIAPGKALGEGQRGGKTHQRRPAELMMNGAANMELAQAGIMRAESDRLDNLRESRNDRGR